MPAQAGRSSCLFCLGRGHLKDKYAISKFLFCMREDLRSRQFALSGLVSLPLEKSKLCWRERAVCSPWSSVGRGALLLLQHQSGLRRKAKRLRCGCGAWERQQESTVLRSCLGAGDVLPSLRPVPSAATQIWWLPSTVSSHLSFDLSKGDIPFLHQDCC